MFQGRDCIQRKALRIPPKHASETGGGSEIKRTAGIFDLRASPARGGASIVRGVHSAEKGNYN